jgi:hypothetical protein
MRLKIFGAGEGKGRDVEGRKRHVIGLDSSHVIDSVSEGVHREQGSKSARLDGHENLFVQRLMILYFPSLFGEQVCCYPWLNYEG